MPTHTYIASQTAVVVGSASSTPAPELYKPNISEICGRSLPKRRPKIVGGAETHHGEFPWLVSIRLDQRHFCGGALLDKQWILTAAHCVASWTPMRFSVKMGK